MKTAQTAAILSHLEAGNSITQKEASKLYDCWRLAARVKDLRDKGYPIKTVVIKPSNHAEYKLVE